MEDILVGDEETAAGGGANKETGILSLYILWPSCPNTSEGTQPALLRSYYLQLSPAFPHCMGVARRPWWAQETP